MPRTWLITGCSTGFGRLLSEALLAAGENVLATARNEGDLESLYSDSEDRLLRLRLDVTKSIQVHDAVAKGIDRFGSIDVLVNNAGYGYFGTQEEGEIDQIRAMYDVNVFGLIEVTQAVLPHMRQNRNGTIVNISSMAGRMGTPKGGFYQSTKWAVEALSESLYTELSQFGVRVILIEPGAYLTDFGPRSAKRAKAEDDSDSPYAEIRKIWFENASTKLFPHRQNPMEVIDAITSAVEEGHEFLRVPVGVDANMVADKRFELGMDGFVKWIAETYNLEAE